MLLTGTDSLMLKLKLKIFITEDNYESKKETRINNNDGDDELKYEDYNKGDTPLVNFFFPTPAMLIWNPPPPPPAPVYLLFQIFFYSPVRNLTISI